MVVGRANRAAVPLLRYQRRWFADRGRFKIGMFARQTGKTFTTTLEIVDDCFAVESRGQRTKWVILSRGERQSREAMDIVKRHAQAYSLAIEELEADFKSADGKETYKLLEVVLPGGSRIIGLPANPDTARGFSGNVYLDEFAFHADSAAIWKALFPVISAGYKIRITSTPNGKRGKFYALMTGTSKVWSRHQVDIYTAVADGLDRNIEELKEGLDDPDAWQQEFELKWLDEASAWLDWEVITAVEEERAGDPSGYQGGLCYVGNDIARVKDLWCAWIWEKVGDVFWCREIAILRGATFAAHDLELDRIMAQYRVARLAMDQTGMGAKPVEDAKRRYGAERVEGVTFTGPAKLALATLGKTAWQDRKVRIPMGDTQVRADLHALRKLQTASGAPRFDVDAAEEGLDGHSDRAWAAFLGLLAADAPPWSADWRAATTGGGWDGATPLDPDDDEATGLGSRFGAGAW